jgi:hypothetical protein
VTGSRARTDFPVIGNHQGVSADFRAASSPLLFRKAPDNRHERRE